MSEEIKKPIALFVGVILMAIAAVGGAIYVANMTPPPTKEALALSVEERAIFDFDIQFAAVGTIGKKNTQTTAIGQLTTDIQDLGYTQKQEVRATLAAQHIKLEQTKVDPAVSLVLDGNYLVRMSHALDKAYDVILIDYLKKLLARLEELKASNHYKKGKPAQRFQQIYDQVKGGLAFIGQ